MDPATLENSLAASRETAYLAAPIGGSPEKLLVPTRAETHKTTQHSAKKALCP